MPPLAPFHSVTDLSSMKFESRMKDDHRYNALRNADTHSESSTEVEDVDSEQAIRPRRQRRARGFWKRLKRHWWMIDTALLLAVLGLVAEKKLKPHRSHTYEFAGDISGFAPTFSQQITTFKPDSLFVPENPADFWSPETQQAWLDLVPEGLGYVEVKDSSRYSNLPHPIHDYPNTTVFTTSMTHQLHCIYTILDAYSLLQLYGDESAIKMPWHITHCFDYLRQAIMCAGDVALEGAATTFPPDPETGADQGGSDGWDARHVCKDYSQVYDYLEKRTINHYKWISSD